MGENAEMHIAAFEAGLDPDEMDGADWAEFFEEDEPITPKSLVEGLEFSAQILLSAIDDLQDSEEFSREKRAEFLQLYIPYFSLESAQTLVNLLTALNDAARTEAEKLQKGEQE